MFAKLLADTLTARGKVGPIAHPGASEAKEVWLSGREGSANVTSHNALKLSPVFNAVTLISNACKIATLRVYQRAADGNGRLLRAAHPVDRLLHRRPNPNTTPARFRKYMVWNSLMWGVGLAEIVRNGQGVPAALYPVHPSWIEGFDERRQLWLLRRNDTTGLVGLPDRDVLQIQDFTLDGAMGTNRFDLADESLSVGKAAQMYGVKFFENSARPDLIITGPATLTAEQKESLRRSWQRIYGSGSGNNSKVAVLEDGFKADPLSVPNDVAQFLETRQFQVVEVARWFNLPPHKLKDLERATFSNIEEQNIETVVDGYLPHMIDFEQECDRKLLTEREQDLRYYCKFNADALLRGDIKTRYEAYEVGKRNGWITADEIREREDMETLPDGVGAVATMESNMTTVANIVAGRNLQGGGEDGPDTEPAADEAEGDNEKTTDAMRAVIAQAARRIFQKERDRVLKAARKHLPDNRQAFDKWSGGFYAELRDFAHDALGPVTKLAEVQRGERIDLEAVTVRLVSDTLAALATVRSEAAADLALNESEPQRLGYLLDAIGGPDHAGD